MINEDLGRYRVVIVGTGTMAAGITAGFVAAGMPVTVLGRDAERAAVSLQAALALSSKVSEPAAGHRAASIDDAPSWDDVFWVIETVAEDLALKQRLFAWMDAAVPPGVPIGSNSSGYPISRIAEGLATRRRMFNAHYFMPAHVVPLVEVAMGTDSDAELGEAVCALYRRIGKKPVLVRRDIPGFLGNRIQHALMREALSLIDSGIASAEDVDTAVRYSFGFRYAAAGPILQKEISGWDSMARAAEEIYPSLSTATVLARCVADRVAVGHTGMKAGEGFRRWSPEEVAAERMAYEARLRAAFEVLGLAPER